jgi:hypothetical protein
MSSFGPIARRRFNPLAEVGIIGLRQEHRSLPLRTRLAAFDNGLDDVQV